MYSKISKYSFIPFLFFVGNFLFSQSVTPFLVGSAGDFNTTAWGSISASVGEPMVTTETNGTNILTQGFQQPNFSGILSVSLTGQNTSCLGANDGMAQLNVLGGVPPFNIVWSTGASTTANFSAINGLSGGTYLVTVTAGNGASKTDSVIVLEGNCLTTFHIYSGITPNGDGMNDDWHIDDIELYPNNSVMIFNRWGDLVWDGVNYDNTTVVWKGTNKAGKPLTDATYFYIVKVNDETYKGWVELTR